MRSTSCRQQKNMPASIFKTAVGTALIGATLFVVAQAQERESEFTRRAYVGVGVGATELDPRTPNSSITVSDKNDAGYHVVLGYDFTSRLAAEVYYADLGSAEIAFLGEDVGPVDYQVFGLSGLIYLINSRTGIRANKVGSGLGTREGFSLYGRVGLGVVDADSELDFRVDHDTHLALGLGVEYGFRNGFALRGEYITFDTDQQYASVSLVKRFGKLSKAALPVVATVATPIVAAPPPAPEPKEPPQKPTLNGVESINFDFNESVITAVAANRLDRVAAVMADSDITLLLDGHADAIDSEGYNQTLSEARAQSARRYLESKGIASSRVSIRGFGETRPIASNDTDAGRAANRRVDIRIE